MQLHRSRPDEAAAIASATNRSTVRVLPRSTNARVYAPDVSGNDKTLFSSWKYPQLLVFTGGAFKITFRVSRRSRMCGASQACFEDRCSLSTISFAPMLSWNFLSSVPKNLPLEKINSTSACRALSLPEIVDVPCTYRWIQNYRESCSTCRWKSRVCCFSFKAQAADEDVGYLTHFPSGFDFSTIEPVRLQSNVTL